MIQSIKDLIERIRGLCSMLMREILKFGVVGIAGVFINNGIWWLLVHGPMHDGHTKAKIISGVITTIFAWVANRYWTFRHKRQTNKTKEFVQFMVINGIGVGIEAGCVFFTNYVLGLTDTRSSFIAGGVVGLILGTIFRFLAYRYWVFSEQLATEPEFKDDIAAQDQERWHETGQMQWIEPEVEVQAARGESGDLSVPPPVPARFNGAHRVPRIDAHHVSSNGSHSGSQNGSANGSINGSPIGAKPAAEPEFGDPASTVRAS